MRFGRKSACAAPPRMNFYRFGAFQTIPHPLRGSSIYTREPWVGAIFGFVPQRKQKQKSRFQNRKRQQNKSRALSLSRSATAPSRREPWVGAIFGFVPQRKHGGILRLQNRTSALFSFCDSAVRHHEPFWEGSGTRERDGRSPRDGKAAHFAFSAPQFVPAKAALFLRGELSAERLTEGCCGSAGSGVVPHNRE